MSSGGRKSSILDRPLSKTRAEVNERSFCCSLATLLTWQLAIIIIICYVVICNVIECYYVVVVLIICNSDNPSIHPYTCKYNNICQHNVV